MKKRNKTFTHFLVLALGNVCFFALVGWSAPINEVQSLKAEHQAKLDTSGYYSQFVRGEKEVPIFVKVKKQFRKVGTLAENATVKLDQYTNQDVHQPYFKLKGKNLYVKCDDVIKADETMHHQVSPAYLPFPKVVQTKHRYTLYDEADRPQLTLKQFQSYPIYLLEDNRYGIVYGDTMYFIHKEDILSTITFNAMDHEESANSIPVLMYHFFYDASKGEVPQDSNFTDVGAFRSQLKYLKDQNYTTLTMKDIDRFMDQKVRLKKNVVSITMDDGSPSVYQHAFPVIKEFHAKATAFLITGWNQNNGVYEYAQMAKNGIELQSHSDSMHQGGCHKMGHGGRLMCVDKFVGIQDTVDAFKKVGNGFVYCYPFGDVNEHGKQIIQAGGAKLAFTTKYGKIAPGMDKLELPRVRISGGIGIENFAARLK